MARSPAHAIVSTLLVVCLLFGIYWAWIVDHLAPGALPALTWGFLGALFPYWIALLLALYHRKRWQLITVGVVVGGVLLLWWNPFHPRKRFLHDLYSVQTGMTVDEVEAIMGGYMKGWGARFHPGVENYEPPEYPTGPDRASVTGTMTYRWSAGAFDADWGQIRFSSGRVVEVEFHPD